MGYFKRLIAALAAAALTAMSFTPCVYAEAEAPAGENAEEEAVPAPEFRIINGGRISMRSGFMYSLSFKLSNTNLGDYHHIKADLTAEDKRISIKSGTLVKEKGDLDLAFLVETKKTMPKGDYPLVLTVTACDEQDKVLGTSTLDAVIALESTIKLTGLNIDSYKASRDPIRPGDKFDLTVTLSNDSGVDVENAELALEGLDSSKFILDKGFTKKYLNIKDGEKGSVTFPLIAQKGISLVRENLTLTLAYSLDKDTTDLSRQTSTSVILNCLPDEAAEEYGKYDLVMTDYKISVGEIANNSVFTFTASFRNNGKKNIEHARISLGETGGKFAVESGLSFRDISIPAGQTKSVSFSLIGCSGISAVRETIPLSLEYGTVTTSVYATVKCLPASGTGVSADKFGVTVTDYKVSSDKIAADKKFTLYVTLKNSSEADIKNIKVSPGAMDGTKFAIDSGLGSTIISLAPGESKRVSFDLIGCSGISSTREVIPISVEYGESTFSVNATVACVPEGGKLDAGKYDISVTDYSVSVPEIASNTQFTLNLTLKNKSASQINGARIDIAGLDGTKFAADSGLTYRDFDIGAGETKSFSFPLIGCGGISSVRETLSAEISYGSVTTTALLTLRCKPKEGTSSDGSKVFAPNIIIENYTFGDEFVTAGQKFPLAVTIKNTSEKATIENLKATVNGAPNSVDGSIAYSPANSSNSFFFEKIDPRATADISLELLAKADAAPNSYPISISFSFEYSIDGDRYEGTPVNETLTVPLQQEDRLDINEPEVPGWQVPLGEQAQISTNLINKGKSAVYNVSVSVSGDGFICEQPNYYIGNINSGTEEYYDVRLTPTMEGDISGELTITYEDANGDKKEKIMPFTFSSMMVDFGMDGGMDYGMDGGMEGGMDGDPGAAEEGMPVWAWFVIGGGAAVIIVVVIIIIVKVNKKKKAQAEDDDEDI